MHKKICLTNLYFNRFLFIRYATALFLFVTLYWSIFLFSIPSAMVIFPFTLFVLSLLVALEQIKLYRNHSNQLPFARLFYWCAIGFYCLLLFSVYTPLYHLFFPFLMVSARNTVFILVILSLVLCFFALKKLNKIQKNQDKHFGRVQAYEKIIN